MNANNTQKAVPTEQLVRNCFYILGQLHLTDVQIANALQFLDGKTLSDLYRLQELFEHDTATYTVYLRIFEWLIPEVEKMATREQMDEAFECLEETTRVRIICRNNKEQREKAERRARSVILARRAKEEAAS
jgi:hypothetical protein